MKSILESASAKFILFGEHAVVHGQPAVAIPIPDIRAFAEVRFDPSFQPAIVSAEDIGVQVTIDQHPDEKGRFIFQVLDFIQQELHWRMSPEGWKLRIWSHIPMARGLGSSAAVSIALLKALIAMNGKKMMAEDLIRLSFELEKYHHGKPSGIDNTVIVLEKPIRFQQPDEIKILKSQPFCFVIGDTGIGRKTGEIVAHMNQQLKDDPKRIDSIFHAIGEITGEGVEAFEEGEADRLGGLMNRNQSLLKELELSGPELDRLIAAARSNGALGAKLCGAGKGGCMVSLSPSRGAAVEICSALSEAGAHRTFITETGDGI